jgi:hypothetical protein
MTRRVRRTCNPASRRRWYWLLSGARRPWPSWCSSMTFTPPDHVVEGSGTRRGSPGCSATERLCRDEGGGSNEIPEHQTERATFGRGLQRVKLLGQDARRLLSLLGSVEPLEEEGSANAGLSGLTIRTDSRDISRLKRVLPAFRCMKGFIEVGLPPA